MAVIDSDAHVIETEQTWDYFTEADKGFKPIRLAEVGPDGAQREFWLIDGRLYPLRRGTADNFAGSQLGDNVSTPDASRFVDDVHARVRHMDELQTDVQVLYPTMLINPYTDRPDVELAICRSYNRWMADIWANGEERLRWAVVLPMRTIDEAVNEMRWAKEHGACAVFSRGIECGNKLLNDPHFFPVYEEAQELDLPFCVHTGNGSFELSELYGSETGFSRFKLIGVGAFHHIVFNGIPDKFPRLRFGFIELSCNWVPYVVSDIVRRFERMGRPVKGNWLRDNRIYVTCQNNDDLPYVINFVGDDNLVMGTDYGHADTSTEIYALQTFRNQSDLATMTVDKILDANARALYAL
jgi:predicted TIM-barrel fold metal-dependent hydrolase